MMSNLIKYFNIVMSMKYNNLKVNNLNIVKFKLQNPRVRVGGFLYLKQNHHSSFLLSSNEIHNNVNLEIEENGVLNLGKASWICSNVSIYENNVSIGKYSAVHYWKMLVLVIM